MTFLLYGANGYTGELIARRAVELGLRPVLGGRTASAVERLANTLGLEHRVASVDNAKQLRAALDNVALVLNCAGPFSRTADAIASACLHRGVHYLDITGEMAVFESLAAREKDAKAANVMLLPGVGFDVVPSDCLAAFVARQLPSATQLAIAIQGSTRMSRGTALTSLEGLGAGQGSGAIRRNGEIVRVPPAWKTRDVDFGRGPVRVATMPWGDVSTAFHSTGIPNVEVYMAIPTVVRRILRHGRALLPLLASAPVRRLLERRVRRGAPGPTAEQRARGWSRFWAEARDDSGRSVSARLVAPEGYELTVRAALECAQRVLRGDWQPGFQTPSRAYGPDLVLAIDGVRREPLPSVAASHQTHRS
jgi:short subunit dehydrogenase-like uncharacterized protein